MELFVLRHGEAGKPLIPPAQDFQRTLTQIGIKKVKDVGDSLKEWKVNLDKILTSPLKRSLETASIIAKVLNMEDRLEKCESLGPEGNRSDLYKILSRMKRQSTVMIVGHEPYLSTLIGEVISGNPNSHISLKKGGLAKLEIQTFFPKASGELKWLLTPKQIKKIK